MAYDYRNQTERTGMYYQTNGAAAYDINRQTAYGTAAPKLPEPRRRARPRPRPRPKAKLMVAPLSVVGLVVAACMLVFVICGYVQLFEETSQVAELKHTLSSLKEVNERLQDTYDRKLDVDVIQARAAQLGMGVPNQKQTVYLTLKGVDHAEISGGTESFAQTAWKSLTRSMHALKAYIKKQ